MLYSAILVMLALQCLRVGRRIVRSRCAESSSAHPSCDAHDHLLLCMRPRAAFSVHAPTACVFACCSAHTRVAHWWTSTSYQRQAAIDGACVTWRACVRAARVCVVRVRCETTPKECSSALAVLPCCSLLSCPVEAATDGRLYSWYTTDSRHAPAAAARGCRRRRRRRRRPLNRQAQHKRAFILDVKCVPPAPLPKP